MVATIVYHRSADWDQSEWCQLHCDSTLSCQVSLLQPHLRSSLISQDLGFQLHGDLLSFGLGTRLLTLLALLGVVHHCLNAAVPCLEYSAISTFEPWQSPSIQLGVILPYKSDC